MSGPYGPDPNQPWPGQQPTSDPTTVGPAWQQAPAYQPEQYPQYQPPAEPAAPTAYQQYPQGDQYAQQPPAYGASAYAPPTQYGQAPSPYGQDPYAQQADPYAQQADPYGQQPDPYGQGIPPGQQFPPYGTGPDQGAKKKSSGLILGIVGGLVVLIVAVVAVLGFLVGPKFFVTTKLDVAAAQTGVTQILTDEANGYGAKNVKDVTCNNGQSPVVKKGDTFDCEVTIDGTKRQVTVTFQDDKGTYEVGRPK